MLLRSVCTSADQPQPLSTPHKNIKTCHTAVDRFSTQPRKHTCPLRCTEGVQTHKISLVSWSTCSILNACFAFWCSSKVHYFRIPAQQA